MKQRTLFAFVVLGLLALYSMPASTPWFQAGVLSGVSLLNQYMQNHFLLCLAPAFFVAGAITVFVRKELVLKYLGGDTNKAVSYGVAATSGTILTSCSCTVLPLFAGIWKRGAGLGPAITFLFSGPAINIPAMFLTISVLGAPLGGARIVSSISMSVIIGLVMATVFARTKAKGGAIAKQTGSEVSGKLAIAFLLLQVLFIIVGGFAMEALLKAVTLGSLAGSVAYIALAKFGISPTWAWLTETWSFTKMILPYLLVGVFVAGFIEGTLPSEWVAYFVGQNTLLSNLAVSIFGAFMYFSTMTEVPIVQALLTKGIASGPALALMLSGPSLSLPSMLVINRLIGGRKTVAYVALVIVTSAAIGLAYGSFF